MATRRGREVMREGGECRRGPGPTQRIAPQAGSQTNESANVLIDCNVILPGVSVSYGYVTKLPAIIYQTKLTFPDNVQSTISCEASLAGAHVGHEIVVCLERDNVAGGLS